MFFYCTIFAFILHIWCWLYLLQSFFLFFIPLYSFLFNIFSLSSFHIFPPRCHLLITHPPPPRGGYFQISRLLDRRLTNTLVYSIWSDPYLEPFSELLDQVPNGPNPPTLRNKISIRTGGWEGWTKISITAILVFEIRCNIIVSTGWRPGAGDVDGHQGGGQLTGNE